MTPRPETPEVPVLTLLRGRAKSLARGQTSAIDKREAAGPVEIGRLGLTGDEQADPKHHGGPDKAIHHYPLDHYAAWRKELAERPNAMPDALNRPGAFGENVSTEGLSEEDVCVGDLWRAGSVLLEVSQARQPCWKLNERFGVKDMAYRVQTSGRTGWYYRVREEGRIAAGDMLTLVDRPYPDWPLSRILHAFYVDRMNRPTLEGIAALKVLPPSWRTLAQRRLESGRTEDWSKRLDGIEQERIAE